MFKFGAVTNDRRVKFRLHTNKPAQRDPSLSKYLPSINTKGQSAANCPPYAQNHPLVPYYLHTLSSSYNLRYFSIDRINVHRGPITVHPARLSTTSPPTIFQGLASFDINSESYHHQYYRGCAVKTGCHHGAFKLSIGRNAAAVTIGQCTSILPTRNGAQSAISTGIEALRPASSSVGVVHGRQQQSVSQ